MQWTDIKNVKTIHDHTRRLVAAGLIVIAKLEGDHEGSVYEVILPEESNQYHARTSTTPVPAPSRDSVPLPYQNSVRVGMGNPIESKDIYVASQTSYKTNTERSDDDTALAGLFTVIKTTSKEITGKDLSPTESDRWKELAEVLMAELKIAAARTTVSNVPAFLAEHLRRRLWKIDKKQARAEGRELPDEITTKPQSSVETRSCPDCGGSGWWYPEGEAKGVAKCKHEKLTTES